MPKLCYELLKCFALAQLSMLEIWFDKYFGRLFLLNVLDSFPGYVHSLHGCIGNNEFLKYKTLNI